MRVEVLLFAALRELAGTGRIQLDLRQGASVDSALEALLEQHPGLRAALPGVRFAVNEEFADGTRRLESGDTLALIPPVSGG